MVAAAACARARKGRPAARMAVLSVCGAPQGGKSRGPGKWGRLLSPERLFYISNQEPGLGRAGRGRGG